MEDDVSGFLGFDVLSHGNSSFIMTQKGLADRVIKVLHGESLLQIIRTPENYEALGSDKQDGEGPQARYIYSSKP